MLPPPPVNNERTDPSNFFNFLGVPFEKTILLDTGELLLFLSWKEGSSIILFSKIIAVSCILSV